MFNRNYKYKIAIKGSYGESNFGDDALMLVLFNYLKQIVDPNQIVFLCKNASYLSEFIPEAKILTIEEQKNATAEVFIYGGGTQFFSFQDNRSHIMQFLSILKSEYKLILHKMKYKYTIAIGVGLGPFMDRATEFSIKKLYKNIDYIVVRDKKSYSYINNWKIDKAKMFTDICYSIETPEYTKKTQIQTVGIIVRDWNHTKVGAAYYNKIIKLYTQLEAKGYLPTLIIFAKNSDKFWMIEKNKFKNILIWNPENTSINNFMNSLNSFDLFITARFHGAVFSSLLNKPFISIVVEDKLEVIAEEYPNGAKKWFYPFDVSQCISMVQDFSVTYNESSLHLYSERIGHQNVAKNLEDAFQKFIIKIFKDH